MPIWPQGFEREILNNGAPFDAFFASFGDEFAQETFKAVSLVLVTICLLRQGHATSFLQKRKKFICGEASKKS